MAPVVKEGYDPKKALVDLEKKALEGKGFVAFVAVLTDRKGKDGNFILDFHYTRDHYGFEDLRKAVDAFREECRKDVVSTIG
jgi:hypothetical protein